MRPKKYAGLSEEQIDELVIAEANDPDGWETEWIGEAAKAEVTIRISLAALHRAEILAARAEFETTEAWLAHLISNGLRWTERVKIDGRVKRAKTTTAKIIPAKTHWAKRAKTVSPGKSSGRKRSTVPRTKVTVRPKAP